MQSHRFDLAGRTALITGASGGLGAHFAVTLAETGAKVVLAARRTAVLEEGAAMLRARGLAAETLVLDVAAPLALADLTARLSEVDILVNNAGVVRDGPALDQSEADWNAVIDVNLKGMFLIAQTVARAMKAHGRGGAIVNVSSILGLRQANAVLPYAVSKAGVIQMTKIMALEWARFGIRVNALAPGYISTDLNRAFMQTDAGKALVGRIPQRRLGDPDDLDGPLLLLCSDAGRFMTGSVIVADGGHLVSGL